MPAIFLSSTWVAAQQGSGLQRGRATPTIWEQMQQITIPTPSTQTLTTTPTSTDNLILPLLHAGQSVFSPFMTEPDSLASIILNL